MTLRLLPNQDYELVDVEETGLRKVRVLGTPEQAYITELEEEIESLRDQVRTLGTMLVVQAATVTRLKSRLDTAVWAEKLP